MAYKFQLGAARLSGSTTFEEAATFESSLAASSLSASSLVSGHQLDIETSANIAGDIDSAGDLTVGSITMSEFTVDSSGNTDVDGTLNVEGVPTFQAGAVFSAGITTAGAIAGATTISGSGLLSATTFDLDGAADIGGKLTVVGVSDLDGGINVSDTLTVSAAGALAGATTISGSGTISGGALTVGGAVTAGKLVVGSADMNEADLEKLDGITNGTAAASKALVLDGSKDIAGINALSAASLSASAAVSGFSLDIENGSNIGGATVLATAKVSDLTAGRLVVAGTAGELQDSANLQFDGSNVKLVGSISGSGGMHFVSGATFGTSVACTGSITAGSSFIIGSADINESDLEQIDEITAGTVAASKAVVVDSNKDIAGFRAISGTGAITAGTSFIIGAANLDETDLEKLDGITNGTVAANKAVVVDGNKDAAGFRDVSADQDVKAARHVSASATLMGGNLLLDTNGTLSTAADPNLLTLKTGELAVDGDVTATNISGSGTLQVGGEVTLDGVGEAAGGVQLSADGFYIRDDSASGKLKFLAAATYATAIAGSGLSANNGQLSVTTNNVSSVVSGSSLSEGYNFVAATATASAGMVLPSSPSVGDFVVLKAGAGVSDSNFIEVHTGDSSHKIDGGAGPIRIESPFGAVSLIYVVANDWRIV